MAIGLRERKKEKETKEEERNETVRENSQATHHAVASRASFPFIAHFLSPPFFFFLPSFPFMGVSIYSYSIEQILCTDRVSGFTYKDKGRIIDYLISGCPHYST